MTSNYDKSKRALLVNLTVKELIEVLKTVPQDAIVLYSGFDIGWLHESKGGGYIRLDSENLDEYYEK